MSYHQTLRAAVADAVRTSLGPKGMDKMIQVWKEKKRHRK